MPKSSEKYNDIKGWKRCFVSHPLLRGDKETEILTMSNSDIFRTIFGEIFDDQQYREGLDRVRNKKGAVIVDLGANCGLASLYFASNSPYGRIVAVEPQPHNFFCLEKNLGEFDDITLVKKGIRAFVGRSLLSGETEAEIAETFYGSNNKGGIVECITIEDLFTDCGLNRVDVLKIDVEGCEYEIFMTEHFKNVEDRIDFIIGESHFVPLNPLYIPEMLPNYDVRFLDFKNLLQRPTLNLSDKSISETYSFSTLFVATRKGAI